MELKGAKYDLPRIAESKYLKFIFKTLQENELLDLSIEDLKVDICPECDMDTMCTQENSVGELTPLCLDGMVTLCLNEGSVVGK